MKRMWASVGAITAVALALRWFGAWYGWPYVFHPDEPHVVRTAVHFFDPETPDLNPHFFQYPGLYIYLTTALYAVAGWLAALLGLIPGVTSLPELARNQPAVFHLGARLLSGVMGAATVPLVFLLGRRLYGPTVALLAAALAAVNFLSVREAHYATTDASVTFFVVAAVYAAVRVYNDGTLRWYVLAGVLSGLAAATKYPAGIVVLAALIAHVLRVRSTPGIALVSPRPLVALAAAVDAFCFAAPYTLLDPQAFFNALFGEWVAQQIPQSGEATDVVWYYLRALPVSPLLAIPGIALALAALVYVAWQRDRRALLLLAFPLLFYPTIGTAVVKVERYFMPLVPFVVIAVAVLLVRLGQVRLRPVRYAGTVVGVVLLATALVDDVQYVTAIAGPDTRLRVKEWMENSLPPGTPVAVIEGAFAWQNPPLSRDRLAVAVIAPPYQDVHHFRRIRERELLSGPAAPVVRRLLGEYSLAMQPVSAERRAARRVDVWRPPSPAELQRRGVEYVVLTDQFRAWALGDGTAQHFPQAWKIWQDYFVEIDRLEAVRRFEPDGPFFGGFAQGGGITVYRTRDASLLVTSQPR